jgi:hypothetical protein
MNKTMHLRWLRLKRQTRLNGPRAAQRRSAPWATLPIFTEIVPVPGLEAVPARPALRREPAARTDDGNELAGGTGSRSAAA